MERRPLRAWGGDGDQRGREESEGTGAAFGRRLRNVLRSVAQRMECRQAQQLVGAKRNITMHRCLMNEVCALADDE